MWWAIFKCVGIFLLAGFFGLIFTSNVQAWSVDTPPNFRLSDVKAYNSTPCSGNYEYISVKGEGSINACVMGKNTRIASYFPAQGGVAYAIRFPFEDVFYRLDACTGILGCVYAEENDTFVGLYGGYRNLVSNLVKSVQNGVIHYSPSTESDSFSMTGVGSLSLEGKSVAISNNGKWILVEMKSYGIFRINTSTLQMRRVIAPGVSYGLGHDPRMELAISNDGNTIAVMGTRMGVWVVSINESCGDYLNEFMQPNYIGAVTSCRFLNTPTDTYIPGFSYATSPRFSIDDESLSFDVHSVNTVSRHVTLFSNAPSSQADSYYVAVGDSFTSGEGEIDDTFYIGGASNRCHLSTRSYPFLLSKLWDVKVLSTACSGATIDAAYGKNVKENQTAQLSELESLTPQFTTIGIGGNDAGLMGKLKDCLGLNTCKWAETPKDRRGTVLEIKNLYPRLRSFYMDVKNRTLKGVIAVGYPLIISEETQCASPIGTLLNQTERRFMNEGIRYLNRVIQAAALDVGIQYANVENAFSGNAVCNSIISPLMNEIRIGGDIAPVAALPSLKVIGSESFHPKPEGHVLVANKIYYSFPDLNSVDSCAYCNTPTAAPSLSAYWDATGEDPQPQRAALFLDKTIIQQGGSFEVSLPPSSLKPSSNAALELHSDVKNLGVFHARADGSLQATISVEDLTPGFHSVHVIGESFSGDGIDIYDFLQIEDKVETTNRVDNFSGTSVSTPRSTLQQKSNTVSKYNISDQLQEPFQEVLGLSTLSIPSSVPLSSKSELINPEARSSKNPSILSYGFLFIVLGIGSIFVLVSLVIYMHYRAKPS